MNDMVERSILLATQIRAVDVAEAVTLVLNAHFLPDLMGNLKSFATQKFRCKTCNAAYRRPPLTARCMALRPGGGRCDGELLSTVYEGSVRKYLALSQRLGSMDGITPYVRQRIQVLGDSLATLFPGAASQRTLDQFPGSTRPTASDPARPPPPRNVQIAPLPWKGRGLVG